MSDVKLTKTDLRFQQVRLSQLNEYLPTLRLKKALLQSEINNVKARIAKLQADLEKRKEEVQGFAVLLTAKLGYKVLNYIKVEHVVKRYENVAGVELPIFETVVFPEDDYSLFDTPVWFDGVISKIKKRTFVRYAKV